MAVTKLVSTLRMSPSVSELLSFICCASVSSVADFPQTMSWGWNFPVPSFSAGFLRNTRL